MAFNSVAEIYDEIDGTRTRLLAAVGGLSAEQQGFRPGPERWSVAEICEHLSLVEAGVTKLVTALAGKAEAAGSARASGSAFEPVSIDEQAEQTRARKLNAPENARPTGSLTLDESLASLERSRSALRDLRPRLEAIDGHAARFPHPTWGAINLYQWLLFVGAHEARHLAQIEAVKEAMNAGPNGG